MVQFFDCPHCGERLRKGRESCPHCGSDDLTGWKSEADIAYESLEIPETHLEDEEYEAFLKREGSSFGNPCRGKLSPSFVGVIVLIVFLIILVIIFFATG